MSKSGDQNELILVWMVKDKGFDKLFKFISLGEVSPAETNSDTLNIACYVVPRYSRRWGSNPQTLNQSLL